jgi:Uma2 family endonuclease
MSLTTFPVVTPPQITLPQRKRWTVAEFHALVGQPQFENRRMILVEGEILEMPAPNPPHNTSLALTQAALQTLFADGFWVRSQMPLVLGLSTDPVPDLALVPGAPRDWKEQPRSALLVVEISDSTLSYDLREKANLYAAGGIKDYWVVDLVHRTLHVCRDPAPDPKQIFGAAYRSRTELAAGERAQPLSAAEGPGILVGDFLP